MKVLQVLPGFTADPFAGAEVYVQSLMRHLSNLGLEVCIATPSQEKEDLTWEGIRVRHFRFSLEAGDLSDLYGEGDRSAAEAFARLLEQEQPDLVHLHAFTRTISIRLVREIKRRGIPICLTYHSAEVSCQRGTLMRWGKSVCDGLLRVGTCSRCTCHAQGVPRGIADLVGSLPVWVGKAVKRSGLSGSVWTACRMSALLATQKKAFDQLTQAVDHFIATAQWVADLLIRNGVLRNKVTLCRYALPYPNFSDRYASSPNRESSEVVRVVFLGRLHPIKGLDVVIQAIRGIPELPITLDCYGLVRGEEEVAHQEQLFKLVGNDSRIVFKEPLLPEEIVSYLRAYDYLVVPSQVVETGPIVVLEAFAAQVPVLGSALAAITDWVQHEVNGLLAEPFSSAAAWESLFRRICKERMLCDQLRNGIAPPPTMQDVAQSMEQIYQKLTQQKPRQEDSQLREIS